MSGEEHGSTETAPVVAATGDQNEHQALRRLLGVEEEPMVETRERWDASSELSSPPNSAKDSDSEEEEKKEEKDDGRPNFRREKTDAEALKSDREWFNRGEKGDIGAPTTPTMGTQKPLRVQQAMGPKSVTERGTVRQFLTRKRKGANDARDKKDENMFATPGKMGEALARRLKAA